ncbi:MAG: fasciclin domain-containing protein [Anaerolineae bacterium]|nr:fasciclin domain-containing protein [Anaerolineae bacterium]MDQ7033713.1 fasciclin domain-containing protein [Anaerolineae bacterium]
MRRYLLLIMIIAIMSIPLLAQQPTIAQILLDSATDTDEPQFRVLLAAALESGLLTILDDSDATITVFAPTDEAFFAALAEQGISYSDLTADTNRLIALLTYHVVDGRLLAEDIVVQDTLNTLYSDTTLSITTSDDSILLNEQATLIETDIEAENGIIHVIDRVLIPPEETTTSDSDSTTLADIVSNREDLSTIWTALEAAGFTNALAQDDQIMTLFLPTNAALEAANLSVDDLGIAEIAYHAVETRLLQDDLQGFDTLPTQLGADISVTVTDSGILLNGTATIIEGDIIASNGVIHIIDQPLLVSTPDADATEESEN